MIDKAILFVLNNYLFIGIGTIFLAIALTIIFIKRHRAAQKEWEKELRTNNLLDKSSLKRPYINTSSIGKRLAEVTKQVVYAQYAQDVYSLPVNDMDYDLYMQIYNALAREFNLGIKNKVVSFNMPCSTVVEQTSESLSVITQLVVESFFEITYTSFHVSYGQREDNKAYKQRFDFVNESGRWLLKKIHEPEIATDYEWEIAHSKKEV